MAEINITKIIDELFGQVLPHLKKMYTAFWADICNPQSTVQTRRLAKEKYLNVFEKHQVLLDDAKLVQQTLPPRAQRRVQAYIDQAEKILTASDKIMTLSAYAIRQDSELHPKKLGTDYRNWDFAKMQKARERRNITQRRDGWKAR